MECVWASMHNTTSAGPSLHRPTPDGNHMRLTASLALVIGQRRVITSIKWPVVYLISGVRWQLRYEIFADVETHLIIYIIPYADAHQLVSNHFMRQLNLAYLFVKLLRQSTTEAIYMLLRTKPIFLFIASSHVTVIITNGGLVFVIGSGRGHVI